MITILTLLISIVPFVIFGEQMEAAICEFIEDPQFQSRRITTGAIVAGLLAVDILLPIPSTFVCTVAGLALGPGWGTLACWIGLNISSLVGYVLGSCFGWPIARRLSSEQSLSEMQEQFARWGVWPIVIFRVFPVLAEASVLLAGVYRMPQRLFWPSVLISNLGIAITFVALGDISARLGWFSLALPISLAVPVVPLLLWITVWRKKKKTPR